MQKKIFIVSGCLFLSFEWNLIRLGGPAHKIVYTKLCQGVVGVVGVGGWPRGGGGQGVVGAKGVVGDQGVVGYGGGWVGGGSRGSKVVGWWGLGGGWGGGQGW